MEFLVLVVVIFALNAISQAVRRNRQGRGEVDPTARPRPRVTGAGGGQGDRERPQTITEMIEEFRRSMEEAERKARGEVVVLEPPTPVESIEDEIEERESLEVVPVARSLEVAPQVAERAVVDLDEEAEEVIQERLRWAEQTARGRRPGAHAAFDKRIRREAAPEQPEVAQPDLRQAIIWREVLGPPVSLRDDYSG